MQSSRDPIRVEISARFVFMGSMLSLVILLGLHATFVIILEPRMPNSPMWFALTNMFNMGAEANIPTLWSTLLLLYASALLLLIAMHSQRCGLPGSRHWTALSAIFFFLCIDESAQIHDGIIGSAWAQQFGRGEGITHYVWYLPVVPLVVLVAFAYLRFVLALPSHTRRYVISAGVLYLGGALGLEMVESWLVSTDRLGWLKFSQPLEEGLEIAGISVFVYALLRFIERNDVRLLLEPADANSPSASATRNSN